MLTRIAACLRTSTRYQLRDTDGNSITEAQGRAIIAQRYTIPPKIRGTARPIASMNPELAALET